MAWEFHMKLAWINPYPHITGAFKKSASDTMPNDALISGRDADKPSEKQQRWCLPFARFHGALWTTKCRFHGALWTTKCHLRTTKCCGLPQSSWKIAIAVTRYSTERGKEDEKRDSRHYGYWNAAIEENKQVGARYTRLYMSLSRSVTPSVTLSKFSTKSCQNCIIAPAHPHATDAVVYTPCYTNRGEGTIHFQWDESLVP